MYDEKKAKISKVRSSFPATSHKTYVIPPPRVPDFITIRDFYHERKENITNVKSAVPSIYIPKDLKKPPDVKKYEDFLVDRKEKITNSKPAIPLVDKAEITVIAPKAGFTHEKLEEFLKEKKLKITIVSPAIPYFKKQHMSLLPPPPSE